MTVEFWTGAEKFYEFWFVVLTVLLLNIVILIIFGATYTTKKNKNKFILLVIGSVVFLGGAGILGHARYHRYLEQASYTNALIRDREPRWTGYVYYGTGEQSIYSDLNDLETLRKLELYKEERVTEPVNYLGEGKYFHYFEHADGEIFKYSRQVEFTETAKIVQLVGSQFSLKDETFREIGFKNPKNTMYEHIEIPSTEQGKSFEPEDDSTIPRADEKMRQWNF